MTIIEKPEPPRGELLQRTVDAFIDGSRITPKRIALTFEQFCDLRDLMKFESAYVGQSEYFRQPFYRGIRVVLQGGVPWSQE